MTFNIRKGLGASGRESQLKPLREAIRSADADVVFLQEVMGHTEKVVHRRAGDVGDQLEFLADSVWSHYAYGKNAVHSTGHHGNAILSKYPIMRWENVDISTNPLERRGLLHAMVQVPSSGQEIHLICLHLNLIGPGKGQQLRKLVERVRNHMIQPGPLVIAGDFNDWSGRVSKLLQEELTVHEASIKHQGQHHLTFPSWLPLLPLDRIYFRDLELQAVERFAEAKWRALSDHQALVAEFKL